MEDVDDLIQLKRLTEETMLECLSNRFWTRRIYTATGPVLLALNPYQQIPHLYSASVVSEFQKGSKAPHIFGIAQRAYSGIVGGEAANQSILISGESGAGKTETTKLVMGYLSQRSGATSRIEGQILESNPLLEAFGNARTLRNDNSSRFGKFIQLFFSKDKLTGAKIETYLLEKVRVSTQAQGERNFHIFYQCCAAAAAAGGLHYMYPRLIDSEERFVIKLSGFTDHSWFSYLTASTACFQASSIDDLVQFERTIHALRVIGMSVPEIEELLSIVASVLHIGNVNFAETDQGEGCCVSEETSSRDSLSMVEALLELPPNQLETALCTKSISVSSSEGYRALLPAGKARDVRDALARYLYGTLFSFLVKRINSQIVSDVGENNFIGLLDIFGFEYYTVNTFEQLCINYANERLQQLFVDCVLRADQVEYELEGIAWNRHEFPDNSCVIDLLDKSVFPMLDEECRVVAGNDANYLSKLVRKESSCRFFSFAKSKSDWFTINHFAGAVGYKVSSGFVEKNRDTLSGDIVEVCKNSRIFSKLINNSNSNAITRNNRFISVSLEFRNQLTGLMELVSRTTPSFIRCIKPNNSNDPHEFNAEVVFEQLRYGGVVQAVQISRSGYPVRVKLDEFSKEFRFLVPKKTEILNRKKIAENILSTSSLHAVVGTSKVFFKQIAWDQLNQLREKRRLESILKIQSIFRMFIEKSKFNLLKKRLVSAQSIIRTALVVRQVTRNQCATKIQAAFFAFIVRRFFKHVKSCVVKIQRNVRSKLLKCRRKIQRNSFVPVDLVKQMQQLGAELRIAQETMKTVESGQSGGSSRLAYFNSGTPHQSYFAPHLSIPPAPFFLSRRGGVSSRYMKENAAPTVRTSTKIGSIEKRVMKVHGDMAKMKELIDRIQNNMSDL